MAASKYVWTPLFLVFAIYEYFYGNSGFCGTTQVTGQMWFMWLMMAIAASSKYYEKS
jgi:hypothetical protein